jgi:acetylserotonin N-methyltransferase
MGDPTVQPDNVLQLIEAFRSSKTMFAAVSLGVFDRLESGAAPLAELAADLGCQHEPLERLLDACVGLKLICKLDGAYRNEPSATVYLCSNSSNTLVGYILYSNRVLYPLWAHLEAAVRTGDHQWKMISDANGGIFDQFFKSKESMSTFLKGMHGMGTLSSPLVVSAFDLSPFHLLVDIGGATGHLARAACAKYPQLEAIVFDLPNVIEIVRNDFSTPADASRIRFATGDMFDVSQLPEADLYALGRILHDWPDEKALTLLRGVYDRLPHGGGVLLAEKLLAEDKSGPVSAQMQSLNMLLCTEGKERTSDEYRSLLESAGFEFMGSRITGSPLDAVFARKP